MRKKCSKLVSFEKSKPIEGYATNFSYQEGLVFCAPNKHKYKPNGTGHRNETLKKIQISVHRPKEHSECTDFYRLVFIRGVGTPGSLWAQRNWLCIGTNGQAAMVGAVVRSSGVPKHRPARQFINSVVRARVARCMLTLDATRWISRR